MKKQWTINEKPWTNQWKLKRGKAWQQTESMKNQWTALNKWKINGKPMNFNTKPTEKIIQIIGRKSGGKYFLIRKYWICLIESVKLFYCLGYQFNAINTINIRTLARTTGLVRQYQCYNILRNIPLEGALLTDPACRGWPGCAKLFTRYLSFFG